MWDREDNVLAEGVNLHQSLYVETQTLDSGRKVTSEGSGKSELSILDTEVDQGRDVHRQQRIAARPYSQSARGDKSETVSIDRDGEPGRQAKHLGTTNLEGPHGGDHEGEALSPRYLVHVQIILGGVLYNHFGITADRLQQPDGGVVAI